VHIQQTSEGFEFAVLYIQSGALQDIAFHLRGQTPAFAAMGNVRSGSPPLFRH